MVTTPVKKICVPELEGYFGSKGGNGVYQQIISLIPPHKILVVPFLGHCAIVRNIAPADILIGVDAAEHVICAWKNYLVQDLIYTYRDEGSHLCLIKKEQTLGNLPETILLFRDDALHFLSNILPGLILTYVDTPEQIVIYQDPPYPLLSRRSRRNIYEYEMTDTQHSQLLSINERMTANILISTYDNVLYEKKLRQWNEHSFMAATRRGKAEELVYYNYGLDTGKLHDYRFLGKNFKDRERIRLKIKRWASNLGKLEPRERMAIFSELEKYN